VLSRRTDSPPGCEPPATAAVGPLEVREGREAADVLARAFRDNPLNMAVIGEADPARRLLSNAHGMRSLLPVALRHGFTLAARDAAGVRGALIASPPYQYPLPAPPFLPRLRTLLGQGLRVARRWGEVFRSLEALHPLDAHWYLGTLGVDPKHQGRGLGSALLAHWLAEVDAEGVSAYLETDSEANVAFYARAGFAVVGETEVLGARVWLMSRPARGAGSLRH